MKVQTNPIPVDGALWSALDDLWNAVNDAHGQLDEGELSATDATRAAFKACTTYLVDVVAIQPALVGLPPDHDIRNAETLPPAQPKEQS